MSQPKQVFSPIRVIGINSAGLEMAEALQQYDEMLECDFTGVSVNGHKPAEVELPEWDHWFLSSEPNDIQEQKKRNWLKQKQCLFLVFNIEDRDSAEFVLEIAPVARQKGLFVVAVLMNDHDVLRHEATRQVLNEIDTSLTFASIEEGVEPLYYAIESILTMISGYGATHMDFLDVQTVLGEGKAGAVVVAEGASSFDMEVISQEALERLAQKFDLSAMRAALFIIKGDENISFQEVSLGAETVAQYIDENCSVLFGTVIDEGSGPTINVIIWGIYEM